MSFKQDLYWCNLNSQKFPNKKIDPVLRTTISKTFLRKIREPFFIYTGTGPIDFDFLYKDEYLIKKLSRRSVKIFLYEPVSYYFLHYDYILGYYSEFHNRHDNSPDSRASELDSIEKFAKDIKGINLYHCDYGLSTLFQKTYPNINFNCRDIFIRQAALSWMPKNVEIPAITKKFWCGNGRYTVHRHIMMCYLAEKPGNYSWWYNSDINWSDTVDWIENLPFEYLDRNNKKLNEKPLTLDFDAGQIDIFEKSGNYIPEGPLSQPNIEYKRSFEPCFVCVINETRFAQPTANFSEKVIDAINYSKPFILVAPPKTLEYLKKLGVKTFSEYWSEEYDNVLNHNNRMLEIFRIIDEINSMSLAKLNQLNVDMQDILNHNRQIIKNLPINEEIIHDN